MPLKARSAQEGQFYVENMVKKVLKTKERDEIPLISMIMISKGGSSTSTPETLCIAGTYDGGIVGWEINEDYKALKLVFAYTPHQGSVRALALPHDGVKAGHLLVSGGVDEHIRMYDLRRRAEVGELLYHKGTITSLGFVGSTHLLSGSDDGAVCIWRVYDWSLVHILGGHKGPVTSLAIHPSGKLALSTSRDRTLRLWDLIKGRSAYITRLEAVAESVQWSSDGTAYAIVLGDRKAEVRRTSDNNPTASITLPMRITASTFLPGEDQHFVTACDDGHLRVIDGKTGTISTIELTGHCGRVKQIVVLGKKRASKEGKAEEEEEEEQKQQRRFLTASSDGKVIVWSVDAKGELTPGPSANLGDGVRITCLAAWDAPVLEGGEGGGSEMKKKRKKRPQRRVEEEEEEEREEPMKRKGKKKGKGGGREKQQQGREGKVVVKRPREVVEKEEGGLDKSQKVKAKHEQPHIQHQQQQQSNGGGEGGGGREGNGQQKHKKKFKNRDKTTKLKIAS